MQNSMVWLAWLPAMLEGIDQVLVAVVHCEDGVVLADARQVRGASLSDPVHHHPP